MINFAELHFNGFRYAKPLHIKLSCDAGILRAEYYCPASKGWVFWKLDDLHELLILEWLRKDRAVIKAQLHNANQKGQSDIASELAERLNTIKEINALLEIKAVKSA